MAGDLMKERSDAMPFERQANGDWYDEAANQDLA
jgi:hypothetical protein